MTFVLLFGPPAVGKMTVGLELERLTGLRLFHNHMTVDLVLKFFRFGEPAFVRLVNEFRRRICEEVAASDLPGLIFTFVWGLDLAGDKEFVDSLTDIFRARGNRICYVELWASQEERLRRNETPLRLAHKEPKRNLAHSRERLLDADRAHRLNSSGDFFYPEEHLPIDNTALEPEEVSRRIARHFGLPSLPGAVEGQ